VQRLSAVIGQAVALIRGEVSIYPTDVTLINICRNCIPVSASENNLQMMFKHRDVDIFTFSTLIRTYCYVALNIVLNNNRCGRKN
jgi:hypothetical protein